MIPLLFFVICLNSTVTLAVTQSEYETLLDEYNSMESDYITIRDDYEELENDNLVLYYENESLKKECDSLEEKNIELNEQVNSLKSHRVGTSACAIFFLLMFLFRVISPN